MALYKCVYYYYYYYYYYYNHPAGVAAAGVAASGYRFVSCLSVTLLIGEDCDNDFAIYIRKCFCVVG